MAQPKTMLVTGGAGFIGANLAVSFKKRRPDLDVIALDNLKRRGSELNVPRLLDAGVAFVHGDVRNPEDLDFETKIDLLLECSAEPSVMAGFTGGPRYAINANLIGSINCLELCREHCADMVFLSTSRVYAYQALNAVPRHVQGGRFVWNDGDYPKGVSAKGVSEGFEIMGPKSLYGATKLCSELLIREYEAMYGVRSIINRCGIIAGPWQFGKVDQGLFSLWMQAHYFKRPLCYVGYGGKGLQVRDLLHVDDLADLLALQIDDIEKARGRAYNVGGGTFANLSLAEATDLCREITGNRIPISPECSERPADVAVYVSDFSRATADFGWTPRRGARTILEDVFRWVGEHEAELRRMADFKPITAADLNSR